MNGRSPGLSGVSGRDPAMSSAESTRDMESPAEKAGASTSQNLIRGSQRHSPVVCEPFKPGEKDGERQHVKPQLPAEPVASPCCRSARFQDGAIDIREIGIHKTHGDMKAGISL